ncbi:LysR family transcriptional regulator [Thiopseudomonas denitrificans]|uniref:LysR family transcriptional regulator n=1 Tax=Thiopseudomonas denitrificans TaxID=1501432 RepID=A0A4R6U0D5_9GAMM|nr:LysR substrate-binding domain-containing protein [Thiopseudomonas denitrificans]TDQ36514.1 LysR family transcriptional regulator [Thiopseudomonas denitrificans]
MKSPFNIKHLEAFKAVMEHGQVSRAAAALFLSQSAVSKLIAALEEHTGLLLFERREGRLFPTEDASHLFRHLGAVFAGLQQLDREARLLRYKDSHKALFTIGVLPALASEFSAGLCRLFRQAHPDVHVSLVIGNSPSLRAALMEQRVDVVMMAAQMNHPDFLDQPFLNAAQVCVMPVDHPLAQRDCVSPSDLHQLDFVDYNPDGPSCRPIFEHHDSHPRYNIAATTAAMVIDLVSAGFGVGLVHPASAHWRKHNLCVKPFAPAVTSSYCLSYRSTGNQPNADLLASLNLCLELMVADSGIQCPTEISQQ